MKNNKWLIIESVAGIILVILIIFFVKRKVEDRNFLLEQQEMRNSIKSIATQASQEVKVDEDLKIVEDENESSRKRVEELQKNHKSVIAIIEIPNTEILYPIVQGKDNFFYLDHDKDGNYHPFGEVFLDTNNKPDFSDKNSIVYGHNIRSAKTIFNELLNYENQEYFNKHKHINIYTLEGIKKFEILSVFRAEPEEPYREILFKEDIDFGHFIRKYYERSLVSREYIDGNRILTLSTCFDNKNRFVIQAVEL